MRAASSLEGVVEGLCPEGLGQGLRRPLDEGLPQEGRAGPTPMDPRLVALRSVTGATPTYFCNAAASGKRSRRSPKAVTRRGARVGPAPGSSAKSS